MVYGVWCMVYVYPLRELLQVWCIVYGVWCMVYVYPLRELLQWRQKELEAADGGPAAVYEAMVSKVQHWTKRRLRWMDASPLLSNLGQSFALSISLLHSPPRVSHKSKASFLVSCNLALFLCRFKYQLDGGRWHEVGSKCNNRYISLDLPLLTCAFRLIYPY
jgi:hypothetical protein